MTQTNNRLIQGQEKYDKKESWSDRVRRRILGKQPIENLPIVCTVEEAIEFVEYCRDERIMVHISQGCVWNDAVYGVVRE
jgi:hypothetical protein